jgi:Na+-exporting ATPase
MLVGLNRSDVAKEAANMGIADDRFDSIVRAVYEGRHLVDSIQKVSKLPLYFRVSDLRLILLDICPISFSNCQKVWTVEHEPTVRSSDRAR